MKNILNVFSNPKILFPKLAKYFLIATAILAFTASAAMGLDGAVTHHSLGVATFAIGITLTFIWILDAVIKGFVKPYKELRGEETVDFIVSIVYASLGFIAVILTIVSLAVH